MPDFWTIYHLVVLLGLLGSLVAVVANLSCFGGLRPAAPLPADAPLVSILIPARNEERNIGACVSSLLAQDYPAWELLVLDDHSEDATGEIVRSLIAKAPVVQARLMDGTALPRAGLGSRGPATSSRSKRAEPTSSSLMPTLHMHPIRSRQLSRTPPGPARISSQRGRG
jgi:glycosyltransferase involved in cell wall biosynthesis